MLSIYVTIFFSERVLIFFHTKKQATLAGSQAQPPYNATHAMQGPCVVFLTQLAHATQEKYASRYATTKTQG